MREVSREARRSNGSPSRPFCGAFSVHPRHGEQAVVASYHYSCSRPIELKKPLRGFGGRLGNLLQRDVSRRGDRFCHDTCIRWFRTFSAKRDRRQIWAIGLHHEFPERDLCGNFSHSLAVFESNNSSERNEVVEIKNFICLIKRAAEAMKNAAQFPRVRPHDFKAVFPCARLLDPHVCPQPPRKIELLLKYARLFRFVGTVANLRFDFFVGFSSQRGHNLDLLFLSYFFARQPVIIEPGFADRHDAWALRQFAQWRDHIVLLLFNRSWVYADCCEDGWMFFCQ